MVVAACSSEDAGQTTTEAPTDAPSVVGSWERVGGDFSELRGMVVMVSGEGSDGLITSTPDNQYGFVVGDVKWTTITGTGPGEYAFDDLLRETANDSTSYVPGMMIIGADGTTLEMSFDSGITQDWAKVDG